MAADTDEPAQRTDTATVRDLCLDVIVRERFGGTPTCTDCGSAEIVRRGGTTPTGAQRYECRACGLRFNELTGTVFNNRGLSVVGICYVLHQHEQPSREIARTLNQSYGSIRRVLADLPDDPAIEPHVVRETFDAEELRAAAPRADSVSEADDVEWNGWLKIRILESAYERLTAWEDAHGDCTHTEAIDELLDRLDAADVSVGPGDAPEVGVQNPDDRVTIPIRRQTKRRLKIWKELHGYTFHDAVAVLVDTVG